MFFTKSKAFYDQIDCVAQNVLAGAKALEDFISNSPTSEKKLRELEDIEHTGDRHTHDAIELLNKTFITPLDREDIHELISSMDDVLDYIYGSADRMILYKIPYVSEDLKVLSRVLVRTVEQVCEAAICLKDMKNSQMILSKCVEISRLENEADEAHRFAVANLFANEKDPIQIIKLKEILDQMEIATDRCEDVANVIEGIVLKNA